MKINARNLIIAAAVLLLAVLGLSVAAAQSNTTGGHPYLGITLQDASNGATITGVADGSPAAAAGLQSGDVITGVNSKAVTSANDVISAVSALSPGATVSLSVTRGTNTLTISATLGLAPTAVPQAQGQQQQQQNSQRGFLGVQLQDSANGVTIALVQSGSPAEKAGLQQNDIITAVNGTAVTSAAQVAAAIGALKPGDTVSLAVTRGTSTLTISATLGTAPATAQGGFPPNGFFFGNPGNGQGNEQGNGPRAFGLFGLTYNSADQTWTVGNLPQNSPLYTAGLRQGDVIKTIDGKSYDPAGLIQYLRSLDSSATVTLSVDRSGAAQDIQIKLSDLMGGFLGNMFRNFQPFQGQQRLAGAYLGVTFIPLDAATAQAHNLTVTNGALVTAVADGSPAAAAGLQVNDVITSVNGQAIDSSHTLRDLISGMKPDDKVTLAVLRSGATQNIDVTLSQPPQSADAMPMPFDFDFGGQNGFQFQFPMPFQGQQPGIPQQPMQPQQQSTPNL